MKKRHQMLAGFGRDDRGTIAMIFGLTLLVMLCSAGIAIDFGRAWRVASRSESALEAAGLAAAKAMNENDSLTDSDVRQIALDYYAANTARFTVQGVTVSGLTVVLDRPNDTVMLSANLSIPTTITRIIQINSVDFTKTANVTYKMKRVELAMVLDVTGSMLDPAGTGNTKLQDMQTAAKMVVDTLIVDGQPPKLVRVGLAPFSSSVNAGPYAAAVSGGRSADGCVIERATGNPDTDVAPGPGTYLGIQGDLSGAGSYTCPAALVYPMSNNRISLKTTIDGFSAGGATAGHIGAEWGWYLISPMWTSIWPTASDPAAYGDPKYIKAVLLMTDGQFNTANTTVTSADQILESEARARAACTNMKADGVIVYTVGFIPPPVAEQLLKDCATGPSYYFNASDGLQLQSAFSNIVAHLQNLRVTR